MKLRLSVHVVNYNTRALLERCLKSLFEKRGPYDLEVFVADNNSSDGSAEMLEARFPQVVLHRWQQNVGFTRAINSLLPLGKGDYHLLLHPDVEIHSETIQCFINFFESRPEVGIVGGNLYYPDGSPNPCEIAWPGPGNEILHFGLGLLYKIPIVGRNIRTGSPLEWSHRHTSRVNWVWNACMMIRDKVFTQIGFFDEDFFVWYADWDFCKRAADAGWEVFYLKPAIAIHHERQSFSTRCDVPVEICYKIDGWLSAASMLKDRHVFLKKYTSNFSIGCVKAIQVTRNALRLMPILCRLLVRRTLRDETSFHLRACLRTIHAIRTASRS